jgi:choline dehydrogenase-like flavoprotein
MFDSLRAHRPDELFDTDLCVVGAGPAGIAVAREFLRTGTRVLLVESGGETPEDSAQVLNRGDVVGAPFDGLERGRCRAFGGTTWLWPGQCLPLEREALERRDWVPDSGWPIPAAELGRYEARAAEFFGIAAEAFGQPAWRRVGVEPPALNEALLRSRFSVFASRPDPGRTYRLSFRRATALTVLLHATATRLRLSPSGSSVSELELSTLNGERAQVRAKAFVLCCGGIENARLLLLSSLGERLPALGRYFQDHPAAVCGPIRSVDPRSVQDRFGPLHMGRARYGPRLQLAPAAQRRAGVLSCDAAVTWSSPPGVAALRDIRANIRSPRAVARELPKVLTDLPAVFATARRRHRGLSSAPAGGGLSLLVLPEHAPSADSRITLSSEPDALELPRVALDWRVGELERRTMQVMVESVREEFARLKLGIVEPVDWLDDPAHWTSHVYDTFHHMGATRMASEAARGVVDERCQVHGVDNLFIAGSSVFAACGATNPTFTIVALALRLADHLKHSRVCA